MRISNKLFLWPWHFALKRLSKLPFYIGYCFFFLICFVSFFLLKSNNCKMTLVVTSCSGRDDTRREPSPQFSKQRSNTCRTWNVRAYRDAEMFYIIREKEIVSTLKTRKQMFSRLFLLELFSNFTWGASVGGWPWPCWVEHHMGTFSLHLLPPADKISVTALQMLLA